MTGLILVSCKILLKFAFHYDVYRIAVNQMTMLKTQFLLLNSLKNFYLQTTRLWWVFVGKLF